MNHASEPPPVLYHYTSNSAFLSIIQSRELRLSALSQSNDSLEGEWFKHALKAECREQGINQDRRREIIDYFQFVRDFVMGYGFCLSKNPDQLSQWRGYADGGRGVAIGLDSSELVRMAQSASLTLGTGKIELKKVLYELADHRSYVAPIVRELLKITQSIPLGATIRLDLNSLSKENICVDRHAAQSIRSAVLESIGSIFQLKGSGFEEEDEWRILQEGMRISEDGKPDSNNLALAFVATGSRIVPYHVLKFPEDADKLLQRVVLGPKNDAPWEVIDLACRSAGIRLHGLQNSKASYR
jgi:hypothetical protein